MRLLVTPTFVGAVKKLNRGQKADIDEAVRIIAKDPPIGEAKIGDLAGVQAYKFRMANQLCLIAYRVTDTDTVKFLMVGPVVNMHAGRVLLDR